MKPTVSMPGADLYLGDCLSVMPTLADGSVDAVVTDPPYHLTQASRGGSPRTPGTGPFGRVHLGERGFMGKTWDGGDIAFRPEVWAECLRVAKPGAFLLAFGGTRTWHRLACALEDAGWELRDTLCWLYGQGFPKSKSCLKPGWEPIILALKSAPRVPPLNIDGARIACAPYDAPGGGRTWGGGGAAGRRTSCCNITPSACAGARSKWLATGGRTRGRGMAPFTATARGRQAQAGSGATGTPTAWKRWRTGPVTRSARYGCWTNRRGSV